MGVSRTQTPTRKAQKALEFMSEINYDINLLWLKSSNK